MKMPLIEGQKEYSKNMIRINVFGIFLLILISYLPVITIFAKIFFWSSIFVCFFSNIKSRDWNLNISSKNLIIVFFLLLWMLLRSQNVDGLRNFFLFAVLMMFYISNIPYSNLSKLSVTILFVLTGIISIYYFLYGGFLDNLNSNTLGVIASILIVITYIYLPQYRFFIFLSGILIIMLFQSRSVLIALLLAISIMSIEKKTHINIRTLLIVLTVIIGSLIYVLWNILMSPEFNSFILQISNKDFQSGRLDIWTAIFQYMKGIDWIIGVGGGVDHQPIVGYNNMGLHSTFVFMLFHYGWIGLGLLILLFYKSIVWLVDKKYYYSATFFLFFVIRDFFEITLIQNQMMIAFLSWGWVANGWIDKNLNIQK